MRSNGYTRTELSPITATSSRILKGQGPAAPLGQLDFLVKGVMIGGFALIASPRNTGILVCRRSWSVTTEWSIKRILVLRHWSKPRQLTDSTQTRPGRPVLERSERHDFNPDAVSVLPGGLGGDEAEPCLTRLDGPRACAGVRHGGVAS